MCVRRRLRGCRGSHQGWHCNHTSCVLCGPLRELGPGWWQPTLWRNWLATNAASLCAHLCTLGGCPRTHAHSKHVDVSAWPTVPAHAARTAQAAADKVPNSMLPLCLQAVAIGASDKSGEVRGAASELVAGLLQVSRRQGRNGGQYAFADKQGIWQHRRELLCCFASVRCCACAVLSRTSLQPAPFDASALLHLLPCATGCRATHLQI